MGRTVNLTNGNDRFVQGTSVNNVEVTVFGFGGKDTIIMNRDDDFGGGYVVNAGAGNDTVRADDEFGSIVRLGDGNDTYIGLGFGSFSTEPGDTVLGGAGDDFMAVQTFGSVYFGDGGNDRFFSVGWQNTFRGGTGTDSISYAPRDDDTGSTGGTAVTVDLSQGFTQTGAFRREFLVSIENVTGTGFDDIIIGSSVRNRITGAGGFDDMTGGGGADVFDFNSINDAPTVSEAVDLVRDFRRAQNDKIDLKTIDAKAGVDGNQAFTFIGDDVFTGAKGQLRFQETSGGLFVVGDVDGDGFEDFLIGVMGHATMQATDFIM